MAEPEAAKGPARIVVVEDDPKAAALLGATLKAAGHHVWVVDHPQRAVQLAREAPLAVVVTELRFAGMNGVELAKTMAQTSPETSVVVMTAYSFISSAVAAMEAGAYGYITKPFNPAEVRIVVERAVERYWLLSSQTDKQQFAELSIKDGLTGVYNHRYFKISLVKALTALGQAKTGRLSLLMLDLDNFKQYNDTKGHQAGDQLLRELCRVLGKAVRAEDLVFRYGGEEFVVLLRQVEKPTATLVAERIRTLVGLYTPATVSIGVSTAPDDGVEGETLLAKADGALYRAKEGGKNKVCVA